VQDGEEFALAGFLVCDVGPSVATCGRRMLRNVEDLDFPFPNSLTPKGLFDGHRLDPRGFLTAVKVTNSFNESPYRSFNVRFW